MIVCLCSLLSSLLFSPKLLVSPHAAVTQIKTWILVIDFAFTLIFYDEYSVMVLVGNQKDVKLKLNFFQHNINF